MGVQVLPAEYIAVIDNSSIQDSLQLFSLLLLGFNTGSLLYKPIMTG